MAKQWVVDTETFQIHTIMVTTEELDALNMAVKLLLDNPLTHNDWFGVFEDFIYETDQILGLEDY